MVYPYLTLDEDTEIVHSDMDENGRVKVYIEQSNEKDGFHSAVCMLPAYEWCDIVGFTETQIKRFQQIIENNAHIILELSQCGGIDNAAGF